MPIRGGKLRSAGHVGTQPSPPPETESVYPRARRDRKRVWSQVVLKTGATGCAATTVTGPVAPAISVRSTPSPNPGTRSGGVSGYRDHTATPAAWGAGSSDPCGSDAVRPAA